MDTIYVLLWRRCGERATAVLNKEEFEEWSLDKTLWAPEMFQSV